jgi:hypothetical protein
MTAPATPNTPVPHHELVPERVINATPDKLYRAGGASLVVMNGLVARL